MDEDRIAALADDVAAGRPDAVTGACAGDPALAEAVSRRAADRLVERAASHVSAVDPALFVWPGAQDAVVALAALPGADAGALAGALLRCCLFEAVAGSRGQLRLPGLRLVLDHHAGVVEQLLALSSGELESDSLSPPWPIDTFGHVGFLARAMWMLPGADGAEWMARLLDHAPYAIAPEGAKDWTAEGWARRFDVLADRGELSYDAYPVAFRMLDEDDPPPREAAPALVRFACARFEAGQDPRTWLGRAADVLRVHRTGDPARDAELFWWEASGEEPVTALRWLLELFGPAGARPGLVAAAASGGRVSADVAAALSAEVDRPPWADRDVPWVVTEVREEGVTDVPGDLAPLLGAARLPARTVVAAHPAHGRADAAVEVLADADAEGLAWEAVADGLWIGRTAGGVAARAVRDLGVLRLDLGAAEPPWHVHDRVPAGDAGRHEETARIDAAHLRGLAMAGAPLRDQRRALRQALHQRGVSEYSSALVMRHVRDGVALVAADPDAPGRTRLGGPGRLPVGTPWPMLPGDRGFCLAPLLEIALSELPDLGALPADGTLLVFQETEMFNLDAGPLAGTRVLHVPESAALHEPPAPGQVLFPIPEKRLRGVAVPVPGESELVVGALEFVDDRQATIDAMNELLEGWWPEHWLLGASLDVQGPARHEIPYVLADAPAGTRDVFSEEDLDPERWTLLAQVNEDADVGLGIGDGGSFYLYILERDLRDRRFDRVVGLMQCH